MNIRPVKTDQDDDSALARIEDLWGAEPGAYEGDELEVLLTLVTAYESENHPVPPPSPIEAIRFVMDQKGLKQADLIPYIGSRPRVSEILSGKRNLTLKMIRSLHSQLGIPAEILIQDGAVFPKDGEAVNWDSFPILEIVERKWVTGFDSKTQAEEIVRSLASCSGSEEYLFEKRAACFRKGNRSNEKNDSHSILAWILGVLYEAEKIEVPIRDGGVLIDRNGTPIIALSLRYDRIDNFWFTLSHEIAHLVLGHVHSAEGQCIIDDLDLRDSLDDSESEADRVAQEALISNELWYSHPARLTRKADDIIDLAAKADIHPAIVAGRIRFENNNYRLLHNQVGHRQIRKLFF